MNQDNTLDMRDPALWDTLAGDFAHANRALVDQGLDHKADDAAEAMHLEGLTGTPAEAILADQDNFKDQLRRSSAQAIVMSNPDLVAYLQSHPMAGSVSNDDWANLDKFTRESSGGYFKAILPGAPALKEALLGAARGAAEGFEGAGSLYENIPALQRAEDPQQNVLKQLGAAPFGVVDLVYKTMFGAIPSAMVGAAGGLGRSIDIEDTTGQSRQSLATITGGTSGSFEETFSGLMEQFLNNPLIPTGGVIKSFEGQAAKAGLASIPLEKPNPIKAADPFIAAGEEPMTGLHPEIDRAKADVNAQYVELLARDLENALASTTRERSPEILEALGKRMYGESVFGINADAVLKLYGDKNPAPDDGILGWVPNIEHQLTAARDGGVDDVIIPMKDWELKVDPDIAKVLEGDMRTFPGGITKNEVPELPAEAKAIINEALPTIRAAAGLEPKFAMGDRKLMLQFTKAEPLAGHSTFQTHSFDILDENGQNVGEMEITPASDKTLFVNWIGGQAGLWSNSFGPALVRDIKRQLKATYPDYDYITGYRAGGARFGPAVDQQFAGIEGPKPMPKVRLAGVDSMEDYVNALNMFENGYIRHAQGIYTKAMEQNNVHQRVADAVAQSLQKMGGEGFTIHPTEDIQWTSRPDANIRGLYIGQVGDELPKIIYNLRNPEAGFHELLHYFKDKGLLTDEEWGALLDGSRQENWLDKYKISENYKDVASETQDEEAIAHHLEQWIQCPDELPPTGWGKVFSKIINFLNEIKAQLGFGPKETWESVFKKIESGEIAQRQQQIGGEKPTLRFSLKNEPEHQKAIIEGISALQASTIGFDKPSWERIKDALIKRAEDDLVKHQVLAEKEQAKRLGQQWKADRVKMVDEVAKDIKNRPDIAADLFISNGEFFGQKISRATLAVDKLTPEQRAMLPDHYVSKSGVDPNHLAPLFGFDSGDAMVNALGALEKLKTGADGKRIRPTDFVRGIIQNETDRRMEARHGNLAANVLDAAKDQALSDSSVNVMYEELYAVAQREGVTVFDKAVLQDAANGIVKGLQLNSLNSFRTMQAMGRYARAAERAMATGDWSTAIVHMQKQTVSAMVAARVKGIEADVAKFDKLAKRWAKRDQPGVPPDYANWVHDILQRIGKPVGRSAADIARQIGGETEQTLAEFVKGKADDLSALDVWDSLLDPKWAKPYSELTTDEFQKVNASVRTLINVGRKEKKVTVAGEEADLEDTVLRLVQSLDEIPYKPIDTQERQFAGYRWAKSWLMRTVQVENLLGRWDEFRAFGPWTQTLFRELKDGDNFADAWRKEFSKRLVEADDGIDLNKHIPNTVFAAPPEYGGQFIRMNRASLRAAMLNWGSESNIKKLTKGWGVSPEKVEAWIHANATKEDWIFAQKIWDIFAELKDRSDTMYRNMGRMPSVTVEPKAVTTPFGQYRGGYYPVMFHDVFARIPKLESADALMEPGYESIEPPAGHTKSRVDFYQPLQMDLDYLPGRINQIIHDTAMRPGVVNFAKVLYHPKIRAAIQVRAGLDWYHMLEDYIKGVANRANTGSRQWQLDRAASTWMRQNIMAGLVGFNVLGTAVKHFSTALGLSVKEVGIKDFAGAVRALHSVNEETGESNYQFAMGNSLELQRRDRNYDETVYGSVGNLTATPEVKLGPLNAGGVLQKFTSLRQRVLELGSKPLAFSDKLSSVPTWLAAYERGSLEGMSHGDAVFYADRAVRRAHGSTAITSRPVIMNQISPWLTTFYNFFNDVFNRQVETLWRAGLMKNLAKDGQYNEAMKQAKYVAAGLFAYSIWPAVTENWSSPQQNQPTDSWFKRSAKALLYTEGSTLPVVREITNALLNAKDPDVGLLTAEAKSFTDVVRDLGKKEPFSPAHAEVMIRHAGEFGAVLTGLPEQFAKAGSFAYGRAHGLERPQGPWGWLVGARYGTLAGHSQTFGQYLKGQYDRRR